MISPKMVELSAAEASEQIRQALQRANLAFQSRDVERTLDEFVGALGLALQLGPAPTERVLAEAVASAREMARQQDTDALSALGPALVGLSNQVHETGALPKTAVMEAWAAVASDLGTLFGQLGLALTIAADCRSNMMASASTRALLLDDATGYLFGLADLVDELGDDLQEDECARGQLP